MVTIAIATASYRGDFDRCRLLCKSIDRRVTGFTKHYILVEQPDLSLFETLAGPNRVIIDERQLLPKWLRVFPDPTTLGRRRIWLSLKGPPLRGWHVQQIRKIAFSNFAPEDATLFCDSDTFFIKPTDVGRHWNNGRLTFYRKPVGPSHETTNHNLWFSRAGELLGIKSNDSAKNDYISQAVTWRNDTVRGMVSRIENINGRSWQSAIAARRSFSEYLLYGRYVDEEERLPNRHMSTDTPICHSCWGGPTIDEQGIKSFIKESNANQSIVGIQSFIEMDIKQISRAIGLADEN